MKTSWLSLSRKAVLAASVLACTPTVLAQVTEEPYTISTFAGTAGSRGSANGTGAAARFALPYGVAVDSAGSLYVADTFNYTIRKITSGGTVSTLAGLAGVSGNADGTGSGARFDGPYSVAVDGAANVYVTDTNNHTIRKITPGGMVTTLAGLAGVSGSADGTGNAARFYYPNALAVDSTGNVYVADTFNQTIRKITPDGVVITLAGLAGATGIADGMGSAARFGYPFGLAANAAGEVYVADTYNYTIRKITAGGLVSTLAGSPGAIGSADGTGSSARFNAPRGVAADSAGNIYIADESNDTIRKITAGGTVTTLAGLAITTGSSDGTGSAARFDHAAGVAINSSGRLYIADTQNHTIRAGTAPLTEGALDQTFDAGNFTSGWVDAALLQPDGKVVIAGPFRTVNGVRRPTIARFNADGTLDQSFATSTETVVDIWRLAFQPQENKIILWGTLINGSMRRLNSDGSLDTSFNVGRHLSLDGISDPSGNATSPGIASSVLVQPDGKLMVVGHFSYVITGPGTSAARSGIARFNGDGTFDPSFNPGGGAQAGGFDPTVAAVVRQSLGANNGKLVLQGSFDSFDGHPVDGFVRLNPDGSFSDSFTNRMSPDAFVQGIMLQADDRIVVFGEFTSFGGALCSNIVRLNASGSVDSSFSTEAFANYYFPPSIDAVTQQADGKLLVSGFFHSLGGMVANNVVRLETNGSRDTSFASTAAGPSGYGVRALVIRPSDGKIFLAGTFSSYAGAVRNNVAWVNTDGSVDSTFEGLAGVADYDPCVFALATQSDGKILVGGRFSSVKGVSRYNIVRLNPDSTVDPTFGTLGTEGSLRAILLQPDGKILIAGNVRAVDGIARGGVARLNANGTLDPSFDPGAGAFGIISALALDAAGNVYVGGSFDSFDGVPQASVAKLSPTGVLDTTFNPGAGPGGSVLAMAPADAAGGVIIGGTFTQYDGANVGRIARLNATTGALDTSFNSGGAGFDGVVRALVIAPDGQYYVGGSFTQFNGISRSRVALLYADGSGNASFVGPVMNGSVFALALSHGKVLVSGVFTSPMARLLRLTGNGNLEAAFHPGAGPIISPLDAYGTASPNSALAVQLDDKVLLGGTFNQYNGTPRVCLARLTDSALNFTAVSRKVHGANTFDIDLPLTGTPGVECRSGGAGNNYQVVLTFGGPVTFSNAFVSAGSGAVTSISGSGGNTATVNLSGLTNAQRITITLSAVSDGTITNDAVLQMGVLVGDTNGDGFVNAGDALQTRNRSGQATDATNFRSDVNADGFVNSGDTTVVRSRSGTSLP